MLQQVTAVRFDRQLGSGRTKPCLLVGAADDGTEVEVVTKLAAGCERGTRALVAEALSAMLAADLDLPVPEPFVVTIEADFIGTIPETDARTRMQQSLGANFGSKKLPPGFATYPKQQPLPGDLLETGAEVLAFDVLIANPDRTVANPNVLFNGRKIAIFDHELAFMMEGIIGWRPPWEPGGVQFPREQSESHRHVFLDDVRGVLLSFERLKGAIEALTEQRFAEYRAALPSGWIGDGVAVDKILRYLVDLKSNIDKAVAGIEGALQ